MKKLVSRIERMEEKLRPGKNTDVILIRPWDNGEEMIKVYHRENPGKTSLMIIRIISVKPTGKLLSENHSES